MYAAILIPDFALQAALRLEALPAGHPAALVSPEDRTLLVRQTNTAAREAGVCAGATVPQAVARCPQVRLLHASASAEDAARQALFLSAYTFSPRVEETAEGLCTVDLAGASPAAWRKQSRETIARLGALGLRARIGIAPFPRLAFYAARCADPIFEAQADEPRFAELPLEAADPSPEMLALLHLWGIHTLGALTALPRSEITARLGPEGLALWERASGRDERPLRTARLPEKFAAEIELEDEIEKLEPLLFLLRRLIDQIVLRLECSGKVAEEVFLRLDLADRARHRRLFRIPDPTRDPETIFRMLYTYLENFRTEAPIVGVVLRMKPGLPRESQHGLFDTALADPRRFAETLARLGALTGPDRVGSPRTEPTHKPDAFRLEKIAENIPPPASPPMENLSGLPLRRFRPALPARVTLTQGRPAALTCEAARGAIIQARGPWILSGDWWHEHRWAREEWDIELTGGGLYRISRQGGNWHVEGMYD